MAGGIAGSLIGGEAGDVISDITGYMGMGAMLGSIAGPVGTAVGAGAGALMYIMTSPNAMDTISKLSDKAFKFLDDFPDKIAAFADTIPEKIAAFFGANDDPALIKYDENGNPINQRPTLLSSVLGVFSKIIGGIVKIAPKVIGIVVSLVGTSIVSIFSGVVQGMANLGLNAIDFIESGIMGVKHFFYETRAKYHLGMSEEEANKLITDDRNEAAKNQAARRKSVNASIIGMTQSATNVVKEASKWVGGLGDNVGDALSSSGDTYLNRDTTSTSKPNIPTRSSNIDANQTVSTGIADDKLSKVKEYATEVKQAAVNYLANTDLATLKAATGLNVDINKYNQGFKADSTLNINGSSNVFTKASNEDVNKAISLAANSEVGKQLGLDEATLHALAEIESGKRPTISSPSGTYKGLYQIGPDVARQYGILGKEFDPYSNSMAAVKYMYDNAKYLKKHGIPISGTSLYLAHQQGAFGFKEIYESATKGTPLSNERIKLMLNNVPPNSGINNPVDYIKYYNYRIANKGGKAISVKEINTALGMPISNNNTAILANSVKPSTTSTTNANVVTNNTPTVATRDNNVVTNTNKAMEDSIKTTASNNTNAAIATKQALMPTTSSDTNIVSELVKQTSILERIASNTKETTKTISDTNIFNGMTKEEVDKKIAANNKATPVSNNYNDEDVMKPSYNTVNLARGLSV